MHGLCFLTPKVLANFSPGLERQRPTLGFKVFKRINAESVRPVREYPFRVETNDGLCSQGCRWRSNPGLKLANAFGV